jgi:TRAP-type C4-dicarboxylate transport system substrate-binding protein
MNRRKTSRTIASAFLFVVAAATPLAGAQDAKKLVLRVADQFPQGHFLPRYGIKPWMEHVTKATHGEVQFEYYPAEQLGKAKDLLSLVQSGVADVVLFAPSYASDKMPLTAALELPGMFASSCQATFTHMKLAKEGAILAQREYAGNGVRVLFSAVYPPYQLVSAKRKIDSPRDI